MSRSTLRTLNMQYELNQLGDPKKFQRLVNAILTARFGEDARLTPSQGPDGGSDGETASLNPNMEFQSTNTLLSLNNPLVEPPRRGRYLFQAKYHRTGEQRLSDLRARVVREFEEELTNAVLHRRDRRNVNYFFLVTNLSASETALQKVDEVRKRLLLLRRRRNQLHADIWWGERITASLDWSPDLWLAFPEIFPGGVPPMLATTAIPTVDGLSRTFKLATSTEYSRDRIIKFRQIGLEQQLLDLFVDIDVELGPEVGELFGNRDGNLATLSRSTRPPGVPGSALELLLDDQLAVSRILLEGGPGQGKSTITQMAAQIYREKLLGRDDSTSRDASWLQRCRLRLPIRLELRRFAEWLSEAAEGTVEEYIARTVTRDSGGVSLTVDNLHTFVERSAVILLLDGLDEIGSDSLRDRVLDAVMATIERFDRELKVDLRVVLTSRPPALTGRRGRLDGFMRVVLGPMQPQRIDDYLNRWLSARIKEVGDRARIKEAFAGRRQEPHVEALARNPMQLSVLLQFIYLKGEAFPDRRAELYRDYFQIVIDRDVEKSPELSRSRELVEGLHSFLGFRFHGAVEQGRRPANRREIIDLAGLWLEEEGHSKEVAERYFTLGEERFGLIVALSGEGEETIYGFEILPIQEYFAASYISNRLAADRAHEVFGLLVHRNYWREVALFLAGLRRPNEKADLVARAKAADADVAAGRQMNGRAIILQLLREGVLHQPRHVLTEAMRAAMELLDIKTLRLQRNPEFLVEAICQLGTRYPSDAMRAWIADIAKRYSNSEDEEALAIVHGMARRLLPSEQYRGLVLGYKGATAKTRSLVRMTCPYESADILKKLVTERDYWGRAPGVIWAERFWRAAVQHGFVIQVEYPEEMHSNLVVEFAVDRLVRRWGGRGPIALSGARPPAVWRLQENLELMHGLLSGRVERKKAKNTQFSSARKPKESEASKGDVSYRALSTEIECCLRDLIEGSGNVVASLLRDDEAEIMKTVSAYMAAIKTHLDDPGIAGWVACRCAVEILGGARTLERVPFEGEVGDRMVESLREFYGGGLKAARNMFFWHQLMLDLPVAVRLKAGGRAIGLDGIIADAIDNKSSGVDGVDCAWIRDIPLSNAVLFKEDNSILTLPSDVAQAWLPEESTEAGGPLL